MKAWFDDLIDGVFRALTATIVILLPTLALSIVIPQMMPSGLATNAAFVITLAAYYYGVYCVRQRIPFLRDSDTGE
jgi:hypothetical protein